MNHIDSCEQLGSPDNDTCSDSNFSTISDTCTDKKDLLSKLVGHCNEGVVTICGMSTTGLIDSGSMVTCCSESFYDSLSPKPVLHSITDFQLSVYSAGGNQLPYMGYIEADVSLPFLSHHPVCVPVLVIPTTEYSQTVPIIVGTNVIRLCRDMIGIDDSSLPEAWKTAVDSLSQVNSIHVKSTNRFPITVQPKQVLTVHGLARKSSFSFSTAVTESVDIPSCGLTVCPRVVSLDSPGKTTRVPVRICNMSAQAIRIPPRSSLCLLNEVQVVDSWQPEPSKPSVAGESTRCKSLEDMGVKINTNSLTPDQLQRAREVIGNWDHIFSKSSTDLGKTDLVQHHIRLTDDVPFKQPFRRIPPAMFEEVRQHLNDMLESGAIRKSKSPYCSNVVLIRKKDGCLRLCIDMRQLNAKTVKDAYSLPRINDTLDTLIGAKYFSKLDLHSGFWQVEIAEEDKHKTAFSLGPLGFWECNRMAFGLTNAPSTFQRLMETCMGELNLRECLIFLDDILIFSDTFDEHLKRLQGVFERIEKHGLKLKPSKCEFFKTKVSYLGHVVSEIGIQTDPEKISALTTWPAPTNIKTLRSWLGFTGYYRRFIKDYAKIVKPLNDLLIGHPTDKKAKRKRKQVPWTWDLLQQQAFETIREKLISPPILAYADFKKPFILTTDASTDGLGSVLYQEQDGKERVIAYASRGLRPSERNYPAHKLEFLCLKWAVTDKFHDYLYGNTFEVRTDNNPLTYVTKSAKLDATGHRWLASLSSYNFKLIYRSGKSNSDADGLSRRPYQAEEVFPDVVQAVSHAALASKEVLPLADSVFIADASSMDQLESEAAIPSQDLHTVDWQKEQASDGILSRVIELFKSGVRPTGKYLQAESADVQKFLREWKNFIFTDGILYRSTVLDGQSTQQLVLPSSYKELVLKGLHDDVGHQGRDRTSWLVRQRFFWPGLEADVNMKVQQCPNCIRRKTRVVPRSELVTIQSSRPMELVSIDYLTLERSKGGFENILVITDHFTRYAQAFPTRNQTAHTTARVLYENFIVHYSFPAKLHSDQGRNFESHVIRELCNLAGVKKTRTTPWHPMGNGMTERFNQTLISMLGTLEDSKKSDWKSYVSSMVHAYNATRHDTTGFSPHYLMFGWHPRLAIDAFLGISSPAEKASSRSSYAKKLRKRLDFAYKMAATEAKKNTSRYKKNYDLKVRDSVLEVGDRVLVRNVGLKGKNKLADKWAKDPYIIIDIPNKDFPVYKVQKESAGGPTRTLHRNMLLPFTLIPANDIVSDHQKQPDIGKRLLRPQAVINSTSSEDSESSSDESTVSRRYIIPQRRTRNIRDQPQPARPTAPTNQSSVSTPATSGINTPSSSQPTISRSTRTSNSSVHRTPHPPRRSSRIRRPPDRYGDWIMSISSTVNFKETTV